MDRMKWPHSGIDEPNSPFLRGAKERPLRISFQDSSLRDSPADEQEALAALHALSHLDDIVALHLYDGQSPLPEALRTSIAGATDDAQERSEAPAAAIDVDDVDMSDPNLAARAAAGSAVPIIPIVVDYTNGLLFHSHIPPEYERGYQAPSVRISYGGMYAQTDQWLNYALYLTEQADVEHPDVKAMLADLLDARAHREYRQDILVTTSARLLHHRQQPILKEVNPLTPIEAARLVGLFLRSRDIYTLVARPGGGKSGVDRGFFYMILARHKLPSMWEYLSAGLQAGDVRGDDTATLCESIVERAERALQARDAIGMQFYIPQGNNARSAIMYHFDYLTLLLSGALDAQALIAYRAYDLDSQTNHRLKEWNVSFKERPNRNVDLPRALQAVGAHALFSLITGQHFNDVTLLLARTRNTIHKAGLKPFAFEDRTRGEPQQSLVSVPHADWQDVWDAAERCGTAAKWGLVARSHLIGPTQTAPGAFEPYTFALTLVEECFGLIEALAAATDMRGLFVGHAVPQFGGRPDEDDPIFGKRTGLRAAALGW